MVMELFYLDTKLIARKGDGGLPRRHQVEWGERASLLAEETLINQVKDGANNIHKDGTSLEWHTPCCCCCNGGGGSDDDDDDDVDGGGIGSRLRPSFIFWKTTDSAVPSPSWEADSVWVSQDVNSISWLLPRSQEPATCPYPEPD